MNRKNQSSRRPQSTREEDEQVFEMENLVLRLGGGEAAPAAEAAEAATTIPQTLRLGGNPVNPANLSRRNYVDPYYLQFAQPAQPVSNLNLQHPMPRLVLGQLRNTLDLNMPLPENERHQFVVVRARQRLAEAETQEDVRLRESRPLRPRYDAIAVAAHASLSRRGLPTDMANAVVGRLGLDQQLEDERTNYSTEGFGFDY